MKKSNSSSRPRDATLTRPPTRADVLSVYVGLRPLVKGDGKTSALSRDHIIHVDPSGLLTITGGKWTTYRHMAEDCVDHCITLGRLRDEPCRTRNLRIHGYAEDTKARDGSEIEGRGNGFDALAVYGADAEAIRNLSTEDPALAEQLDPDLPYTRGGGGLGRPRRDGAHASKTLWPAGRARYF